MHAIRWPAGYLPGTTDNFVSNEVVVAGLSAAQLWAGLDDTSAWPTYYGNASEIRFYGGGPGLQLGARFRFTTFGSRVEAEVTEYVPPAPGRPARVAWRGWVEGDARQRIDVHHAWLIEELEGGRVRVLTQETQLGQPARDLAAAKPNPMLNAHQDWLDGLVAYARARAGAGHGAAARGPTGRARWRPTCKHPPSCATMSPPITRPPPTRARPT